MLSKKTTFISSLSLMALLMAGCGGTGVPIEDPSTGSLNTLEDKTINLNDWLGAGDVMAYVLTDDKENIYVADSFRMEIREALHAEVKDNTWMYTNSKGVMETRKEQPLKNINSSGVRIVEWAYARGYACVEKPAGYILPIHRAKDPRRKIFAAYQTTEPWKWCEASKRNDRCKFFWRNVTSRFIMVNDEGKLVKRNGEYVLSDTATIPIMSCVD